MNDFEQDLARTNHLLSDLAATMYELVQAWADEQLDWVDNLPHFPSTTGDFSELFKERELQRVLDWQEEQLA